MRDFRRSIDTEIDVTGRVLEGIALRWDTRYRVSDDGKLFYVEGWRRRAFEKGLKATGNVHEVRVDHHDVRVGRVSFAEADDGLRFTAIADETPAGDAVLEYAQQRRFRGVSLCYHSNRQTRDADGTLWRLTGVARELSLVDRGVPQYEDVGIEVMRMRSFPMLEADEATQADALAMRELLERSARNLAIELPEA